MVDKYYNPLEAYAALCSLPKDGEQWLVVSAASVRGVATWFYIYPSCSQRSLEFLIEKAKQFPHFACFFRHRQPVREKYHGHGPYVCAICGFGHQDHD